jgi:hypothetical protein
MAGGVTWADKARTYGVTEPQDQDEPTQLHPFVSGQAVFKRWTGQRTQPNDTFVAAD